MRTEVVTNDSSALVLTKGMVSVMYAYVGHYFSPFRGRKVRVVQRPPGIRCTTHGLLTLCFSVRSLRSNPSEPRFLDEENVVRVIFVQERMSCLIASPHVYTREGVIRHWETEPLGSGT